MRGKGALILKNILRKIVSLNFNTFFPDSQIADSCNIISQLYRKIAVDPWKILLIERNGHHDFQTIFKLLSMFLLNDQVYREEEEKESLLLLDHGNFTKCVSHW